MINDIFNAILGVLLIIILGSVAIIAVGTTIKICTYFIKGNF